MLIKKLLLIAPLGPSSLQQTKDVFAIMNKYVTHCSDWIQCIATFFATVTHYINHHKVCQYEQVNGDDDHFVY